MKAIQLVATCLLGLLCSCNRRPEPVQYGKDACAHCKMTIMDKRFAAEIITGKGKIFKFDAAECMAGFIKENPAIGSDEKSIFLISDFNHPGRFIDARKSFFLNDNSLSSPMGGNLAAFSNQASAEAFKKDSSAIVYTWPLLLKSR